MRRKWIPAIRQESTETLRLLLVGGCPGLLDVSMLVWLVFASRVCVVGQQVGCLINTFLHFRLKRLYCHVSNRNKNGMRRGVQIIHTHIHGSKVVRNMIVLMY